jgi:hypothetical protein
MATNMFSDISEATRKKLSLVGIHGYSDLSQKTKKEVKSIKGIGPKAFVEIEFMMSKDKIKFKTEPKKYNADSAKRKKIILHFIKNTSKIRWPLEMRNADRLLAKYAEEFIFSIKPKVDVWTLNYFFNGFIQTELDKRYSMWKCKEILPQEEKKEEVELLDFKIGEDKVIEKPKSLKDFLN